MSFCDLLFATGDSSFFLTSFSAEAQLTIWYQAGFYFSENETRRLSSDLCVIIENACNFLIVIGRI
jgi:hypothetical protein